MQYTTIAHGIQLPRLGFGAMRFPLLDKSDETAIDIKQVDEMVDLCMQSGINYFDTAYGYHRSTSEGVLGRSLARYPRESFLLTDKMPFWSIKTESDVPRVFEEQLKRCGVSYFDGYLLHAMNEELYERALAVKALDYLEEQKRQGRIRMLGFSFHGTPEFFERLMDMRDWDLVQIQINYLDWTMQDAERLLNKLREKKVPCISMEPVRGGLLAKLPTAVRELTIRENPQHNRDVALAIRWLLEKPAVTMVLSGMSEMAQLEENIEIVNGFNGLTEQENKAAAAAGAALESLMGSVPCTACSYCMPCPFSVDIPESLAAYGRHLLSKDQEELQAYIEKAEVDGASPARCTSCDICKEKCPQNIDISRRLGEMLDIAKA